jgi:hypothetical protein
MFCVHCGVENPEIGRFCRSCGKALIANTGLSQERLYTTDVLASEDTHPNTQEAVRSSTLPSPRSSERLDETVEAMNEQTAVRAALWIVGGVVGFILLVILIAISARLPSVRNEDAEERPGLWGERFSEAQRISSYDQVRGNYATATAKGSVLELTYPKEFASQWQSASDPSKGQHLVGCMSRYYRVKPGVFKRMRLIAGRTTIAETPLPFNGDCGQELERIIRANDE